MQLISYDISDNRMRRKVAKELENYGVRVQYSVFECNLSAKQYQELYAKLIKISLNMQEGSIRIYSVCDNCRKKTVTIGEPMAQVERLSQDTFII